MNTTNLYRRNGIWYVRFSDNTGKAVRKSLGTPDRKEAKARAADLLRAAWEGRMIIPRTADETATPDMTVREAFQLVFRLHAGWRDAKSPRTIVSNYQAITRDFPEDSSLAAITLDAVLAYTERLRDAGLSPGTINQRLSVLSLLLRYAERPTGGAITPFKMPRQTVRQGRIRVLSVAEEQRVLHWFEHGAVPQGQLMRDLAIFLIDTGFRLGEALRLRTSDVDWESNMVAAWETKADRPRRIPMTRRVQGVLRGRGEMEQPFGGVSKGYIEHIWAKMREGIGINAKDDPEFVLHALRHTCASRLAAAGQDAFRIQKWMGHKTIVTTQKYVTLFASDLRELAITLDSVPKPCAKTVPDFSRYMGTIRPKLPKAYVMKSGGYAMT